MPSLFVCALLFFKNKAKRKASRLWKAARPSGVPQEALRPPQHWAHDALPGPLSTFYSHEVLRSADVELFQGLLDATFKRNEDGKMLTTRDRHDGLPVSFRLAHVLRVENSALWMQFAARRHQLQSRRSEGDDVGCVTRAELSAGANSSLLAEAALPPEMAELLGDGEVYLWHGTALQSAARICKEGFSLKYSGSKRRLMFGRGIYLAECSSKSDEYAGSERNDPMYQGLHCMLLCRAVLGNVLRRTGSEGTQELQEINEALASGKYNALLGDRQAAVGTYREFILFGEDQVYPEYLVLYRREY